MLRAIPSLRPLHPAWPMVATIACLGGSLGSALGDSRRGAVIWLLLALVAGAVARSAIRRHRAAHPRRERVR
jgi:hypothetical protein